MTDGTDENNLRIIFRPTKIQYDRIQKLLVDSGRYKHLSELIRHLVEIGLDELEKEH